MIRIGKIVAVHGLQGAVVMTHIADKPGWLKKDDVLYVELQKESRIPFFVHTVAEAHDGSYIVRLEDVTTVEDARKLIGKHIYVVSDVLAGIVKDTPLLWIGFNLVDRHHGLLGPLEDVVQTGKQWLGKITFRGREALVPLVEQIIIEVNTKNRFIRMDLPEGLLEVYAGNVNNGDEGN